MYELLNALRLKKIRIFKKVPEIPVEHLKDILYVVYGLQLRSS